MDKIKFKLLSISQSLKSSFRSHGPKLSNKNINHCVGGINTDNDFTSDFSKKIIEIIYNPTVSEYYEEALKSKNTYISSSGALVSYSGKKTGRSPSDKRIVMTKNVEDIWWDKSSPNISMKQDDFNINRETAICFLNNLDKLYVFDGYAGWDKKYRIKVRVISSRPYHCFFMHNMLIRPDEKELYEFGEPDYTIYNAGCFPCNRFTGNMTSSTSIDINFESKEIVILGTQYAGEMKKSIFSVMNFIMPLENHLSLHSSCNVSYDNDNIALFFGLSGTGKTTLSADSNRILIGDDEHVWTDEGVFNIEGGCYAKVINLNKDKEPEIYNAIRFGSLLENVILDEKRDIEFDNESITQNTRASYPINYIKNSKLPCITGHPKNVILLTCDAFGVLPPVSKLTKQQTIYHFLNGYTAKIAGTEQGIKEPQATFSACYGEAFLVWHPSKYADLLAKKIEEHNVNCWLVNTGWVGGQYGVGTRCDITVTKQIISEIHNGNLAKEEYEKIDIFDLYIPKNLNNINSDILNPINMWDNKEDYKKIANNLLDLFTKNMEKYS